MGGCGRESTRGTHSSTSTGDMTLPSGADIDPSAADEEEEEEEEVVVAAAAVAAVPEGPTEGRWTRRLGLEEEVEVVAAAAAAAAEEPLCLGPTGVSRKRDRSSFSLAAKLPTSASPMPPPDACLSAAEGSPSGNDMDSLLSRQWTHSSKDCSTSLPISAMRTKKITGREEVRSSFQAGG